MAEKIIEMSKMAPFGLSTPTETDRKSIEPPSKKFKAENHHKLWTHEVRMINEKLIYLNKSTTKYVIIGNDSTTFEPIIKICDRTNGAHITLSDKQADYFIKIVNKLISNDEYDAELENGSGVEITELYPSIWKFKEKNGFGTIVLQKISLQNLSYCSECILKEMCARLTDRDAYRSSLMEMRREVADLDKTAKKRALLCFIFVIGKERENKKIKHHLATSIMCNRPYLETLEEYKDFY